MATHVIQHPDGGRWYTLYGWTTNIEQALRFNSAREGEDFAASMPQIGPHTVASVEMRADDRSAGRYAGQAQAEYDPFGHKHRGR